MARSFTGSTGVYANVSAPGVTTTPLTLACWARPTATGVAQWLMELLAAGTSHNYRLSLDTSNRLLATASAASANSSTNTSALTANTWAHCAGVFSSTTSRIAYKDGVAATTNTTSTVPNASNKFVLGAFENNAGTIALPFTGEIAEAAIWNVALTAAEIAMLAKGVSPLQVRPAALVNYWPLLGRASPEIELRSGKSLTLVGSPAVAGLHPRIFIPRMQSLKDNVDPPTAADLAAVEGSDVSAFSAQHGLPSTLVSVEGADTFSGSVQRGHPASLTAVESADTVAFASQRGHPGALLAVEGSDTAVLSALRERPVAMAAVEASDTLSGAASVAPPAAMLTATLASVEIADTAAMTAQRGHPSALSAAESADVAALAVQRGHPLALNAIEGGDTATLNAKRGLPISLTVIEGEDSVAGAVGISSGRTASFAVVEGADTFTASVAGTAGASGSDYLQRRRRRRA